MHVTELLSLGKIGYVRGIETKLASLQRGAPESAAVIGELDEYVKSFQLDRFMKRLESMEIDGN